MPSSLFGPTTTTRTETVRSSATEIPTPSNDAIGEIEKAIQQSGGDARAAFYAMAKAKGVDADAFLRQMSSFGDPKSMLSGMMGQNPRLRQLMNLFGGLR